MSFDDLKNLTKGFIKGWKKGKLKDKCLELAAEAMDGKVKVATLEEKVGQLQDEIRRLKGEKEKPKIKSANTSDLNPSKKKKSKKKSKKSQLKIDQEIELDVDKDELPADAKSIGSREVVIQELEIRTNNIKFKLKRYYSPSLKKTFEAQLPEKFKGRSFGPQLVSFILYQYYKCRVPHRKILEMLSEWGIEISKGTICSILDSNLEDFEEDLKSARDSAINKCSQVHIDDTGAKLNGMNAHTFGVSNRYFTSFTTLLSKNRWSATGAILGGEERFLIDSEAVSFIAKKLRKPRVTVYISSLKSDRVYSKEELEGLFKDDSFEGITNKQRDIVRTATAISALRSNNLGPPIRFLISDDAGNFKDLIKNHQLCWVHEIRNYKLTEVYEKVALDTLEKLLKQWRAFYKLMKRFRASRCGELKNKIKKEFDRITSQKTLIKPLDEQLERTRKKKDKLLLFLRYPQVPLHNNLSENDLRERVIKRKISLQNRSLEGVRAWDLMLSLSSTCRKIGLNFWKYLEDRVSKKEEIHYLGRLINQL